MYRSSVELSVRYDELSQSEREHASLIEEYTRLILRQKGSICVFIWTLDLQFARLINTHSVLFENVARLNLQLDVLDLNTGLALVVKTLPDGTFSSIWVNGDGIHTPLRFVNTLVQFCGREHACSVSCRFCVLDTGFALVWHSVSLHIRIISSSSSSLVRYVLRLWNCSQLNKENSKENTRLPQWPFHIKHKPNKNYPNKSRWKAPPDWLKLQ